MKLLLKALNGSTLGIISGTFRSNEDFDVLKKRLNADPPKDVEILLEHNGEQLEKFSFSTKPSKSGSVLNYDLSNIDSSEERKLKLCIDKEGVTVALYLHYYDILNNAGNFIAVKDLGVDEKEKLFSLEGEDVQCLY